MMMKFYDHVIGYFVSEEKHLLALIGWTLSAQQCLPYWTKYCIFPNFDLTKIITLFKILIEIGSSLIVRILTDLIFAFQILFPKQLWGFFGSSI